jgi:hypothetical protein
MRGATSSPLTITRRCRVASAMCFGRAQTGAESSVAMEVELTAGELTALVLAERAAAYCRTRTSAALAGGTYTETLLPEVA